MKILHIIASPRGDKSKTQHIATDFLSSLQQCNAAVEIDTLDLFGIELPEVMADTVDLKYTLIGGGELDEAAQARWNLISAYALSFLEYDMYVLSCPMWNFSVPYRLKQYIDIIMQPGILFRFTAQGVEGLALNKKMFCITARGSDYSKDTYLHQFDFQEPYLRAIFGMAGIYDISFIHAQPMDYMAEIAQQQFKKAKAETMSMALSYAV